MGIALCDICCFSLAAFNICSLCLIFVNLINMSWGVSPWVYPVWDSLGFLDLGDYFLPHFREVFNYYLLTFHFHALEKEMATHSTVLAQRIPVTGEPGGLPSMGSHRVRHD